MQYMALASSRGQIFVSGESETSNYKLHFVAYTELYRYLWLPVSPGNFLLCRRHQYNLLSTNLLLPQKLARSSCDVID